MNGVKIEDFSITGNAVRGFSGEVDRYQNFILESDFDVIMNYAAQQWATDLVLPLLNKVSAKKVFVPCGFSGLFLPEYANYFEQMKTWLKQYDACIYMSNDYRDINFARECGADNDVLIPNGAGADEFDQKHEVNIRKKLNIPQDHFLILHVGSHTGIKGHKEAIQIFKKAKIKHASFLIVANSFGGGCTRSCRIAEKKYAYSPYSKIADKKIIIRSLSRKETVAAYHEADLFLFPSNLECSPLTLFEAIASKSPFLTTDVGNAKEIIGWTNGGLLLPTLKFKNGYAKADVEKSADILQRIFHNYKKRKTLAKNGYENWKTSFTWEKITRQYEELYLKLLKT
ncbi:MAG: glycosyltransferase family 4 protein [Desulfobacteraceae bacterium]|nr:glycosyltransferase family 4 protein [Desulfobacteraceae bacterium]